MSRAPRPRRSTINLAVAAALGAAVAVTTHAAPGAVAAAGKSKPVLAGTLTKSAKLTTLKRTRNGPALRLRTKPGAPPLAVTSTGKVANLNADLLDGRDPTEIETTTFAYRLPEGGAPATVQNASFPGLPAGSYLVNYAVTFSSSSSLTTAQCYLHPAADGNLIGLDYGVTRGTYATMSSSGRIDTANGAPGLRCNASSPFTFDSSDAGGMVLFTRTSLDQRDAAAVSPRPVAPRSARSGTASGG